MRIKKGEVYKEKSGKYWFRIVDYYQNAFFEVFIVSNKGKYSTHFEDGIIQQIQSGKLIKIPQLYK